MGYWKLLKQHPRSIGFGFLTAFFSGPGQTHFISLFSPFLMGQLQLNNSQYGSLYSAVTLASGLTIPFVGPMIDRFDIRKFAFITGIGLIISQSLFFLNDQLWAVAIGLFGLRLFGQGIGSSLNTISIARYFDDQRGKALSLSQTGFPIYEGVITPLFGLLLLHFSQEYLITLVILAIGIIYLPLTLNLTKSLPRFNKPNFNPRPQSSDEVKQQKKSWTRKQVFSQRTVYLLIPQLLMPPFALTGIFFHQAAIADVKGWSLSLISSGLIFFASGRIINTFLTGPLVDRFQARKLFAFYQAPLSFAFLVMAFSSAIWIPAFCYCLFGLSVGSGGPIKSAIWAELYGVRHLGAIKSLFATLMVVSTAISPALFGWWIDHFQQVDSLLLALAIASVIASFIAWLALRRHTD